MNQSQLHDLAEILRWMQAAITHPGGIVDGIASPQAREHLDVSPANVEQVLTRSHSMSALDRLEVYGNAYFARLSLPQSRILEVRLECCPSLRLIHLRCPVHCYYDAVRCERDAIPPGPEETHLALIRRSYVVHHQELSKTGYELLTRLARGESLGASLEGVMTGGQMSSVALAPNLRSWFLEWSAAGFFRCAHLPD